MSLTRRIARPLLAAPIIREGLDAARRPAQRAQAVRPLLTTGPAAQVPVSPETAVRAAGAITAVAGLALASGRAPRLAALVILAGTPLIRPPVAFWREKDAAQRAEALAGLGLLGGTLLAAADTDGRPSLARRGRSASEQVGRRAQRAGRRAEKQTRRGAKQAARQTRQAAKLTTARAKLGAAEMKLAARS